MPQLKACFSDLIRFMIYHLNSLLLGVLLVFYPLTSLSEQLRRVQMGVILGLAGPFAPVAMEMQRGMQIAGEEATNVELLFEDDHGMDNKAAVAAFTKLAASDRTIVEHFKQVERAATDRV